MPFLSPMPRTEVSTSMVDDSAEEHWENKEAVKKKKNLTSRAGFQSGMGICSSTIRIVVKMSLHVALDYSSQSPDKVIHLARSGTSNRIRHANAVDAHLVDRLVEVKQIDEV